MYEVYNIIYTVDTYTLGWDIYRALKGAIEFYIKLSMYVV